MVALRAPYFAPEEFLDEPAEARGDLYGAGALLYFLATAEPPLAIARSDEIVLSVLKKDPQPPRPRARDLSSAVETVILEALAKYPEDRFRSATAMRSALRSRPATLAPDIAHRERQARPRPRRVNTRVTVTAGAIVLALVLLSLGIGQLSAAAAKPKLVLARFPSLRSPTRASRCRAAPSSGRLRPCCSTGCRCSRARTARSTSRCRSPPVAASIA
jgi:serine/threonine protein kinase